MFGGDILDAAPANLRRGARVVICGAVVGYNDETLAPGPKRYMSLLVFRATMTGFVSFDYEDRFPRPLPPFEMIADGRLVARETVIDGGVAAFPTLPRSVRRRQHRQTRPEGLRAGQLQISISRLW